MTFNFKLFTVGICMANIYIIIHMLILMTMTWNAGCKVTVAWQRETIQH